MPRSEQANLRQLLRLRTGQLDAARKTLRSIGGPVAEAGLAASDPSVAWTRGGWRNASGKRNGKLGGRPVQELPCRKCSTATTNRDASRRADCGCAT